MIYWQKVPQKNPKMLSVQIHVLNVWYIIAWCMSWELNLSHNGCSFLYFSISIFIRIIHLSMLFIFVSQQMAGILYGGRIWFGWASRSNCCRYVFSWTLLFKWCSSDGNYTKIYLFSVCYSATLFSADIILLQLTCSQVAWILTFLKAYLDLVSLLSKSNTSSEISILSTLLCLCAVGGVMAFLTLHEMLPLAFDYCGQKRAVKAVFLGMACMSARFVDPSNWINMFL